MSLSPQNDRRNTPADPLVRLLYGLDLHDIVNQYFSGFCNGFINLEAAHIKPQAHNGVFLPCNGIAMSRDLHFAFDKGFFTLTPDLQVMIHDDVLRTDSYINQFNKAQILVPQVDYFRPREEFLIHHREHVFGSFRQIRSI